MKSHSWHAKSYKVVLSFGILIEIDNVAWHSGFLQHKTINIVITGKQKLVSNQKSDCFHLRVRVNNSRLRLPMGRHLLNCLDRRKTVGIWHSRHAVLCCALERKDWVSFVQALF